MVTAAPTGPVEGDKPATEADTAKLTVLLATVATVTTTLTFPAGRLGTVTIKLVALQAVGVAVTPPKVTVLVPCVSPKLEPLMVTDVPTGPIEGNNPVITGVTLKFLPALGMLATVTTTLTFPAGTFGTVTVMLVELHVPTAAGLPPIVTVLVPCAAPKLAPEITICVPAGPETGETLLITGGGVNETRAVSQTDGAAVLHALTVTVCWLGTGLGAL